MRDARDATQHPGEDKFMQRVQRVPIRQAFRPAGHCTQAPILRLEHPQQSSAYITGATGEQDQLGRTAGFFMGYHWRLAER